MVKYTVLNYTGRENTKFTRELNTYGFDKNGFGEEFLFLIKLNDKSGGIQETDLATYLVKYKEYAKNTVKITKTDNDQEGFSESFLTELRI